MAADGNCLGFGTAGSGNPTSFDTVDRRHGDRRGHPGGARPRPRRRRPTSPVASSGSPAPAGDTGPPTPRRADQRRASRTARPSNPTCSSPITRVRWPPTATPSSPAPGPPRCGSATSQHRGDVLTVSAGCSATADPGSGSDIVPCSRPASALDGRGPPTVLVDLVLSDLGIARRPGSAGRRSTGRPSDQLVDAVYRLRPVELARFAPLVFEAEARRRRRRPRASSPRRPTPWRRRSAPSSCRTSPDRSCSAAASCRTSRQSPERGRATRSAATADERRSSPCPTASLGAAVLALRTRRRAHVDDAVFARVQTRSPRCADRAHDHAEVVLGGQRRARGRRRSTAGRCCARPRAGRRPRARPSRMACGSFDVAGAVGRPRLEQPQPAARRRTSTGSCVEQRQRVAGPIVVEQPARPPRRRAATRPAPVRRAATACSAASPRRPSARATSASPRSAHAFGVAAQRRLVAGRSRRRRSPRPWARTAPVVVGQPTSAGAAASRALPVATDDVGRGGAIRRRCDGSCPGSQQRQPRLLVGVRARRRGTGCRRRRTTPSPATCRRSRSSAPHPEPVASDLGRRPVGDVASGPVPRVESVDRDQLVDRRADVADRRRPSRRRDCARRRRRSRRTPRSSDHSARAGIVRCSNWVGASPAWISA